MQESAAQAVRLEWIGRPSSLEVGDLIEAVGTPYFSRCLLQFLIREAGAEHYCVYGLGQLIPRPLVYDSVAGEDYALALYLEGGAWRQDPTLTEAQRCLSSGRSGVLRLDIDCLPRGDLRDVIFEARNVHERIMICGGPQQAMLGLSVLRTSRDGRFESKNIRRIRLIAATLLSLVAKHEQLSASSSRLSTALTFLPGIERAIATSAFGLPRRECEVCARILYGMSSEGIALDLGISEQTVMTYRKRAYERLGIATSRELLLWYLDLYGPGVRRPAIQ